MRVYHLLFLTIFWLGLAACGQSGPLVHPPSTDDTVPAPTAPVDEDDIIEIPPLNDTDT